MSDVTFDEMHPHHNHHRPNNLRHHHAGSVNGASGFGNADPPPVSNGNEKEPSDFQHDGLSLGISSRKAPNMYDRVLNALYDFAEHTSAHGIPRVYTAPNSVKRVLWLLLFFTCLIAFSIQAVLIIQRFFRNDIIVGVELKFEKIDFPSVTVCNLNPYKNSLARSLGSVRATLVAFDNAIEQVATESKRRKRSPEGSSTDQKPQIASVRCSPSMEGMYFADGSGDDDCYCAYSPTHGHTYECAPQAHWRPTECLCPASGVCEDQSGGSPEGLPCLCKKGELGDGFCLGVDFDELEGQWPIALFQASCTCSWAIDPSLECTYNTTGSEDCLCAAPKDAKPSEAYCAQQHAWKHSGCRQCSWQGECREHTRRRSGAWAEDERECLCHGPKCLAVRAPTYSYSKTPADDSKPLNQVVRIRKQVNKVYDKIYNRYDGLIAVYSGCHCDGDNICEAFKEASNSSICLCFYNRKNGQLWPCYQPKMWSERGCHKCSPLGDCVYTEHQGKLPCVCASVIKMCVRIDEESTDVQPFENDNGTSTELLESVKHLSFGNRIPRIWEITTTEVPVPLNQEEKDEAYGFKGVSDPVAIRATAAENLVFAVASLKPEEKAALSYSKREFITKCSFNGRQCAIDTDFDVYIDPSFGNCFTFNYNMSTNHVSERSGSSYGLRFEVFVNISDYLPTTEAAGVRVLVHNPTEQPFPDTHGYSAPTGFVSSFGIRMKRVERLPAPYGECSVDAKDEEFIYTDKEYSTEGCQRSCIQRYLVDRCGCGDPRFPRYKNSSNCPVDDPRLRVCLREQMKHAVQNRCSCPQPCTQEVYSVSFSCARWPSSTASLSNCDEGLSPYQCLQFFREQGALIEVYFEQLNYESLLESEAYGLPNLLSDFGGQLGLWMGVSVITMMEVCILFCELVYNICFCCFARDSVDIDTSSTRKASRLMSARRKRQSLAYGDESLPRFNGGLSRRQNTFDSDW